MHLCIYMSILYSFQKLKGFLYVFTWDLLYVFFNLTVCLGSFSVVVHKVYLILLSGFCPTNRDERWAAPTHTRASSVAFEGDSETGVSSSPLRSACLCTCHTCGSLEPHSGTLRCLASDWERHRGTGQRHGLGSPPWMAWGQGCAGAVVWPGLPGRLPCSGTTWTLTAGGTLAFPVIRLCPPSILPGRSWLPWSSVGDQLLLWEAGLQGNPYLSAVWKSVVWIIVS